MSPVSFTVQPPNLLQSMASSGFPRTCGSDRNSTCATLPTLVTRIASLILPLSPPINVSRGAANEVESSGEGVVALHPSADTDCPPRVMVENPHSLIVTREPDLVAITVSPRSLKVTSSARTGSATISATPKTVAAPISSAKDPRRAKGSSITPLRYLAGITQEGNRGAN